MGKSEILELVGKRIKELRIQKGISQVDLVARMDGNIDSTNISRIESGRTNPTLLTLQRIANALEISLKDLLDV
ncbi:helix-turn-helix transcriptional regulator [Elizabethkingia anophelis]|nr:helix-turn-helix transcriptional regulator [Elizabethkingia anophelis]MCT3995305.1 helix-turn-helix transcriptional regulator [Elizabethkingia anophelis]MCT3998795.1 helix-turn-helix transcriptional regulator [Elizabethkingia anophelis]MCT4255673.1 helix-turn-helix transcriptional regulator [Elizabethkingia anophelis]MDV3561572.1 transcriptional regulator [Elizabethkingia anophelis]